MQAQVFFMELRQSMLDTGLRFRSLGHWYTFQEEGDVKVTLSTRAATARALHFQLWSLVWLVFLNEKSCSVKIFRYA